jgi:hypothetical protein
MMRVLCGLLVLAAAVACGTDDSTSAKSVPPQPSLFISATPQSNGPVAYFYGLGLYLGSAWEVEKDVMLPPDLSIVMDKDCMQYTKQPTCPGFVVAPIEQDPAVRADQRLENGCWSNGVTDDRYYNFPERVGSVTIGGQPAEYYKYYQCSRDTGQQGPEVMHMWRIITKGVVVYDLNLDGRLPTPGLEPLLAGATWKS